MSDKYQQEIEEILKRADEVLPKDRTRTRASQSKSPGGRFNLLGRLSGGRGMKISAGKLMLGSFALLLLALILGAAGVGSVVILVAAGLILFVVAYALFFVRPGGATIEKRWRGRIIEDKPTVWGQLKRWLKG